MFDFLRSLAPKTVPDATRAVAAVPPRFASARPLSAVPPPEGDGAAPEEPPLDADPVRAPAQMEPRRIETGVAPLQVDAPALRSSSSEARGEPFPIRLQPPRAVVPRPLPADQTPGRRGAAGHDAPLAAMPVIREGNGPGPSPSLVTARAAIQPLSRPPAVPAAPLSRAAVASRPVAVTGRPPVIHVTIDRIDVRAPEAGARPARPARPRASASSVSLADYLRGSQRHGGGV